MSAAGGASALAAVEAELSCPLCMRVFFDPLALPCGHTMVAVVCFTGASGASTHSSTPSSPAMTATRRATALGGGTRVDRRRNG